MRESMECYTKDELLDFMQVFVDVFPVRVNQSSIINYFNQRDIGIDSVPSTGIANNIYQYFQMWNKKHSPINEASMLENTNENLETKEKCILIDQSILNKKYLRNFI